MKNLRKFGLLFLLSLPCWAQHTYYISKSTGSDSNTSTQAQNKATPWAHLKGMTSCTSACSSYSPVAGDNFILKGGDTWVASDLGVDWESSGTSGSRLYIGVDLTWFTGASWVRPIFDCQNTGCAADQFGNKIWLAGNFTTIDNIEFKGYQQSTGGTLVGVFGNDNEVENMYLHGWSRTVGSSGSNSFAMSNNFSSGGALRTKMHNNVIDGSDSPNQDFMGGILHGDQVYNNVVRFVYNGMNGIFNDIHGNLVENNFVATSGDHCNMIFAQGTFTGGTTPLYMYNNVVRHAGCAGGVTFWMRGNNSSCPSCTAFAYNNVIYDNGIDSDKGISIGNHPAAGNTGTYFIYNNTIDPEGGSCMGNGEASPRSTTHFQNTHCINAGTICDGTGTTCTNDGGNLSQTTAQANLNTTPRFDQYTESQTPFALAPVLGTNSTVAGGNNLTGSCSGSLLALCSDTSYATYDTSTHVVVMRTINPRPAGGSWDIGAFQFTGAVPPPVPAPATSLMAVVK